MRTLLLTLLALAACNTDVSVTKETDADGDGYTSEVDCDDARASVHPDAEELCDELDNDCDDAIDEEAGEVTFYGDADGDGYGDEADALVACDQPAGYVAAVGDCDDADPAVHPNAAEDDCADPVDYNCDGSVAYADADGDGWAACEDCDDADAARNPDATEVCDDANVDEDCSGAADDMDPAVDTTTATTFTADRDGDGFAETGGLTILTCDKPDRYVLEEGDCDDEDASISPAGTEVCDVFDADEDCDGLVDDADPSTDPASTTTGYADADGDGFGDAAFSTTQCDLASGHVANDDDCDDTDAAISPDAAEVCDDADTDEDCDGLADDADPSVTGGSGTGYADRDGDGYGDPRAPAASCDGGLPSGYVENADDCDDTLASVSPAAEEVCEDGVDNNCDGADDDDCESCEPGDERVTLSTLDYDGMSFYPLDIEDCTPSIGACCGATTTQQQMDAFCQLAGYCEAASWTVETLPSESCYCLGECTGWDWATPCCSGYDTRNFVTEVVCQ